MKSQNILFFFCFVFFSSSTSFSQTLISTPLPIDDYNLYNKVIKLHNGGYAIAAFCGYYWNISHADAIMSKGVVVLDSSGTIMWFDFKDPGSIMAEYFEPSGNVHLMENPDSTMYLVGEWISGKTGVVKYNSSGGTLWVQSTPDTAGVLIPYVLYSGDDNSLYVSGGKYNSPDNGIYLTKIDSSGNVVFRSYHTSPLLRPVFMTRDSVGNFRIFTDDGIHNGHIVTYDSLGNFLIDDSLSINFKNILKLKSGNFLFSVSSGTQFILTDHYFNPIRTMSFPYNVSFISEREDSGYVVVANPNGESRVYKTDTMMNILWSVAPYAVAAAYSKNDNEFYAVGSPEISYRDTNYFVLLHQQPYIQISASPNPVCRFDSVQLSVPSGFNHYEWSNNDSINPTQVQLLGNYFATLEDTSGVSWYTDTINVTSFPWHYIYLGPDTISCVNQPVTFHGGTQFASWLWQDGSVDSVFTINSTLAGNFIVSVISTDTNGCDAIDSVSVTFDLCDGIKSSIQNSQLKLYPNPTSGMITISITNINLAETPISIFDFTGREVFNQQLKEKETQLNLSFLARGVYQFRVSSAAEETKSIKLVIQ
jgi:hypothetical protein